MTNRFERNIFEICELYGLGDGRKTIEEVLNGHINRTYNLTITNKKERHRFIIQRINTTAFSEPKIIMENIRELSNWLDGQEAEECDVLRFLFNKNGENYFITDDGEFWRVAPYVENSVTYDEIEDTEMMRRMGSAFGTFQKQLSGMPLDKLNETIPDFHNTKKRLDNFFEKVKEDPCGRAAEVADEIAFFAEYREQFSTLQNLRDSGELPSRVTHNDTKCNNILFDRDTGAPLTVIDLDTVMPGLCAYDFGDAVRCAANTSSEDEKDLSKVGLNMEYFKAFTEGFVGAAKEFLTESELKYLAFGAPTIAFELASRFLYDYLDGDKYFRILYDDHNLVRARCQIALCRDMMNKLDEMNAIVMDCWSK